MSTKPSRTQRITRLLRSLGDARPFIRASVVVTRKPCIRAACPTCRRGRKHHSSFLTASKSGKPKVRYLPLSLIGEARRRTANWRKTKALLEKLSELWTEELLSLKR